MRVQVNPTHVSNEQIVDLSSIIYLTRFLVIKGHINVSKNHRTHSLSVLSLLNYCYLQSANCDALCLCTCYVCKVVCIYMYTLLNTECITSYMQVTYWPGSFITYRPQITRNNRTPIHTLVFLPTASIKRIL